MRCCCFCGSSHAVTVRCLFCVLYWFAGHGDTPASGTILINSGSGACGRRGDVDLDGKASFTDLSSLGANHNESKKFYCGAEVADLQLPGGDSPSEVVRFWLEVVFRSRL